jgi:hypothetical protein
MRMRMGGVGKLAAIAAAGAFCGLALAAGGARAAAPLIESTQAVKVGVTTAVLKAEINPGGALTRYRFEYGLEDCLVGSCVSVPAVEGKIPAGSSPVVVEVPVEGLNPETVYHFRVVVKNPTPGESSDRIFATYGQSLEGLPDGRAYEQASPLNKDGGDAQGQVSMVKATPEGNAISFGSAFGMPGGKGAEELPTFLANRGGGSWVTQGMLPPVSVGERVRVIGWSPDYSRLYSQAIRLGAPRAEGLVEQSSLTQAITVIGPYASTNAAYSFAGETPDGSIVFFEAKIKLPPKEGGTPIAAATPGVSNLYAWDAESEEVHLAGTFNEGEGAPKGSFAGPYDWSNGSDAFDLHQGGGGRSYYLRGMHAITPAGDVYFTAAGSGQLYLRRNPIEAPSPVDGQGKCTNLELACTIHVSASQKTNGTGGGPDPAGEQPAAFQAASQDGSKVFFTSSEKLTNDANTGPEQPPAAIARAKLSGLGAEDLEAEFFLKRAVGIARFGPWLYWANPKAGQIGRAKLNAEEEVETGTVQPDFISTPPSEGKCEDEVIPEKEIAPGVFEPGVFEPIAEAIPSEPRYVAVDSEHVYWTSSGLREEVGVPRDGGGTIGRAKLNGETVEDIEPAFICGEEASQSGKRLVSNPQGIAVNESHIYWANAADSQGRRWISRAAIDGGEAEENFAKPFAESRPFGVVLSATHLYLDANSESGDSGYLERVTLDGKGAGVRGIGKGGLRGLALDAGHLYWATQGEGGAIGRADLELENSENKFIDIEGAPSGITAGTNHLFWAVNGDTSGNSGNDLYRYEAAGDVLSDLTPLATGNGAEVQGVLGASEDGAYVYFAANGVLPGTATEGADQGDCKGPVNAPSGKCNLYAWHEGQVGFVAGLNANENILTQAQSDAIDWVGTPSSGFFSPRTAFIGDGGAVLVFRSQEKLTAYDNETTFEGKSVRVPEFYRYRAAEPGKVSCLTCPPSGEAVEDGPSLGSISLPYFELASTVQAVASRNLAADGGHFFFETAEALSPADTNGAGDCPPTGSTFQNFPSCLDVYEWEAQGVGQCEKGSPGYSLLDEGCLYLISTGKSKFPSLFGDASEDGKNVFFFTRQQLVGQDQDDQQDVYDARVGGGLPAQNQPPVDPCQSTEACHGPIPQSPSAGSPVTPTFVGPGNPKPKHKKQKAKKKKHPHHKKKSKRNAKGGGGR